MFDAIGGREIKVLWRPPDTETTHNKHSSLSTVYNLVSQLKTLLMKLSCLRYTRGNNETAPACRKAKYQHHSTPNIKQTIQSPETALLQIQTRRLSSLKIAREDQYRWGVCHERIFNPRQLLSIVYSELQPTLDRLGCSFATNDRKNDCNALKTVPQLFFPINDLPSFSPHPVDTDTQP